MKLAFFCLIGFTFLACTETTDSVTKNDILLTEIRENNNPENPACPKNHTDSIIPIIYGYPSEESFQKSDSGLVYLGGCIIEKNAPMWYCKIHDLTF